MAIPFNKPFITGNEKPYISQVIDSGKISGHRDFTAKCQQFFQQRFGFRKALLTTSCSDALEMAAILLDISPGDEVIMPSYNFVSAANAFLLRGANIVFADSLPNHPNVDPNNIGELITDKTRAIVVVHYAGMACDMDSIMAIAEQHGIPVVEDAAHAIDSTYQGKYLGAFGALATFSFHETKNIQCGEGGMLVVNNPELINRSEIIWEKGTNRSAFFRGEVDKYNWVDIGSSFLPSDYTAAFLFAQFEHMDDIQSRRKKIWDTYFENLAFLSEIQGVNLPETPEKAIQNGHLFYMLCRSLDDRTNLIDYLKANDIMAVFHYQNLHISPFFGKRYQGKKLGNAEKFMDRLVRLPLYVDLTLSEVIQVCDVIRAYYQKG